jgi:hypothetical protein
MLLTLGVTTVLLLRLGIGVAETADLRLLAEKGGFFLGNAYRCGVSTKRVDRSGEAIHHLIVAVAYDSTEEAAANSRFTEIFLASAFSSPRRRRVDPALYGGDYAIRQARSAITSTSIVENG